MKALHLIFRELIGLFIDDLFLAIAVVAVIVTASVLSILVPSVAVGAFLVVGCVAVLIASALRTGWT